MTEKRAESVASKPHFDARRGTWWMKYRPDPLGPWVKVVLGKQPGAWSAARTPKKVPIEIEDRRRDFEDIEYRAKHGLSAAPQRAKPLDAYLTEYATRYEAGHKPGSIKQLRRHVENFRAFCRDRGVKTMQAVTKAVCRDYLEMRSPHVAPGAMQAEKGYLSPIWSRAVEDELIAINPWSQAKVQGKKITPVPTFWTSEEIARIVAATAKPWQADLVLVLANTGIRISACLAMRWDWIDWRAGAIRVPQIADKGGYGYTHELGQGARTVLERRHVTSRSDLVFPHWKTGGPISYDTAADAIGRAIRKAGVPTGTAHDLRHSYARALERNRIPMSMIQSQLGHRSASMTMRYISSTEGEAARWVSDFDIGSESTPEPTPPADS